MGEDGLREEEHWRGARDGFKGSCRNHGAAELGHRGNRPSAMLRKGRIFLGEKGR